MIRGHVIMVSIPHREATNRGVKKVNILEMAKFQSLIGKLQTVGSGEKIRIAFDVSIPHREATNIDSPPVYTSSITGFNPS